MKFKSLRLIALFGAAAFVSTAVITCSDDDHKFYDEVTDPYCVETADWFEEFSVSAFYSEDDPDLVLAVFEPTNDIVDMNGLLDVEGADVDTLAFDSHDLWLVVAPYEDTPQVVISGAVDCTTESKSFVLTLYLSPEDKTVTYELSFDSDEPDAGADDDAGADNDAGE